MSADLPGLLSRLALFAVCGLVSFGMILGGGSSVAVARVQDSSASSCVRCHEGIEDMHPAAFLTCVDCHGGDAQASSKSDAHVKSKRKPVGDERVLPLDVDLAYRRFVNPMDLRVMDKTCATCHADLVDHLRISLHGTTAGHLSDGYYEVGATKEKGSKYGIFGVPSSKADKGTISKLLPLPGFDDRGSKDRLTTHYSDLPRKECVQCHLWSEGRAVRGRVGFDGDYRGAGCAACHVPYALDGLSESADSQATRNEPGHPKSHVMRRAPDVQACTTCHYGDASIGLAYRGLSQLPPGAPGGPEIEGTTDTLLNRAFYLRDNSICPPDIHFEKGMHCVDCHTLNDVMGDGQLHGSMEHAVEISCDACHGSFSEVSNLKTERGTPLKHLRVVEGDVILTSKVTGKEHLVSQVVHVLDPTHADYNRNAAEAMNSRHENVECYTCHGGWNTNFLGFHFDRNASFTQLDLLSGEETPGRVTTQEKVFATWKSFYAGLNESGKVAPYMTGFSTMGSVTDEDGTKILDQVLPVTAKGLSGLTMIHHQTHTVRPTARSCVECHRAPATWGLGSENFRLARQLAFVADRRGIETVALQRGALAESPPLAKFVLPDVVDLAIGSDPLTGFAEFLYAAEADRGVHVFDATKPHLLKRIAFVETVSPRALKLCGDRLYVADGEGGLLLLDVTNPDSPKRLGRAATFEATDVHVEGPFAYVADGPGGLTIVDVRSGDAPRVVSGFKTRLSSEGIDRARSVSALFQYSRPRVNEDGESLDRRTDARMVAAVLDEEAGLVLVDVTEATRPERLWPVEDRRSRARRGRSLNYRGLVVKTHVDLAEAQGGARTMERDYVYLAQEVRTGPARRTMIEVWDITNPKRPKRRARDEMTYSSEMLVEAEFYNAPFLQSVLFVPGELGLTMVDVRNSNGPEQAGAIAGMNNAVAIAIEEFPLDRMVDEEGRPLKDVSHEGSRWLEREEFSRILDVPGAALGLYDADDDVPDIHASSAHGFFSRFDKDGSAFLEGKEIKAANAAAFDANGDERVSLLEVARGTSVLPESEPLEGEEEPVADFGNARIGFDGDLSRLLDGIDPHAFDKNNDDKLDAKELRVAFFTALDLDGDERLSPAETSRAPGEARSIRYGSEASRKLFKRYDTNGDGKLKLREFTVRNEEFKALDRNDDGEIQLPQPPSKKRRVTGSILATPEWPVRRNYSFALSPLTDIDGLFGFFDKDGDDEIDRAELGQRDDLIYVLDNNNDSRLQRPEIAGGLIAVSQFGVDAVVDDYLTRWDLNGDGKVSDAELPVLGPWRTRLR